MDFSSDNRSFYDILEVSPDVSDEEIRPAFVALVRRHQFRAMETDPERIAYVRQINQAYDTLRDPIRRRRYDEALGEGTTLTAGDAPEQPRGSFLLAGSDLPRAVEERPVIAAGGDGEPENGQALVAAPASTAIRVDRRSKARHVSIDGSRGIRSRDDSRGKLIAAGAGVLALGLLVPYLLWQQDGSKRSKSPAPAVSSERLPSASEGGRVPDVPIRLDTAAPPPPVSTATRASSAPPPAATPNAAPSRDAPLIAQRPAPARAAPPASAPQPAVRLAEISAKPRAAQRPAPRPPRIVSGPDPLAPTPEAAAPAPEPPRVAQAAPIPIPAAPARAVPPAPARSATPARWISGGLQDTDNRRGQFVGNVAVRFTVEPSGAVSGCRAIHSSGNAALDSTTCRLVEQRLRFSPARDASGRAVATEIRTSYSWGRKPRRR